MIFEFPIFENFFLFPGDGARRGKVSQFFSFPPDFFALIAESSL